MRALTLGGVLGPALFATVVIVSASWRPHYSHAAQFVSELGATATPHAWVMNWLGFEPTGLMVGAFGVSLAVLLRPRKLALAGGLLVAAFGLALVVAGLAHCEIGCPQDQPTLHDGASVLGFVCALTGFALLAAVFRRLPGWRSLWLYSAASSVVGLCFLVGTARSIETREWTGLWQRLLIGTLFLWCAIVGWHAFRRWPREAAPGRSASARGLGGAFDGRPIDSWRRRD